MPTTIEKYTILVCLCLQLNFYNCLAQADTLYINDLGAKVARDAATYYRMVLPIEQAYLIMDFDLNHVCRRKVTYTSPQAVIKHGKAWYYDAQGNRISEGVFYKGYKQGQWSDYYLGGKRVKQQTTYNPDNTYSVQTFDSAKGYKKDEGMYNAFDLKIGQWKSYYYRSDSLEWLHNYKEGKKDGEQKQYYKNGTLKRLEFYANNRLKKGKQYDEQGRSVSYFPSFEYPEPSERIRPYLFARIPCFETSLREQNMILKCTVLHDGSLKDIQLLHCNNVVCEQQIIQAIAKMKKWKPARVERNPIDFQYQYNLKYYIPKD
jgi:antitoxin component YwqK of YwqJK toxin-antitoxin module